MSLTFPVAKHNYTMLEIWIWMQEQNTDWFMNIINTERNLIVQSKTVNNSLFPISVKYKLMTGTSELKKNTARMHHYSSFHYRCIMLQ